MITYPETRIIIYCVFKDEVGIEEPIYASKNKDLLMSNYAVISNRRSGYSLMEIPISNPSGYGILVMFIIDRKVSTKLPILAQSFKNEAEYLASTFKKQAKDCIMEEYVSKCGHEKDMKITHRDARKKLESYGYNVFTITIPINKRLPIN